MANIIDAYVQKSDLRETDHDGFADKLMIYFQRIRPGCDVEILSQRDSTEALIVSFQFTDTRGDKEKERAAVENALRITNPRIKVEEREIPFQITNSHAMETKKHDGNNASNIAIGTEYTSVVEQHPSDSFEHLSIPNETNDDSPAAIPDCEYQSVFDTPGTSYLPLKAPGDEDEEDPFIMSSLRPHTIYNPHVLKPLVQESPIPLKGHPRQRKEQSDKISEDTLRRYQQQQQRRESTQEDKPEGNLPIAINVSGFETLETVKLYFRKQAKILGEDIVGFSEDSRTGQVNITFTNPKVVQALISKDHHLQGRHLDIVPASQRKPIDFSNNSFLLSGLPRQPINPDIVDDLQNYIEARTQIDEQPTLQFSQCNPGVVLVRYSEEIEDIEQVLARFHSKAFKGSKVKGDRVTKPDCILVTDLPSGTHKDDVELYFEDILDTIQTSRTVHVSDVQLKTCNKALVYFDDYEDVECVLHADLPEFLQNKVASHIAVEAFYECLGVPKNDESTSRIFESFVIDVKLSVTEYILNNETHKRQFHKLVQKANAKYSYPYDGDTRKMRIDQVSSSDGPSRDITQDHWKKTTQKLIESFYSEYKACPYILGQRHSEDIRKEMRTICTSCNVEVKTIYFSNKEALLVRGLNEDVSRAMHLLKEYDKESVEKLEPTFSVSDVSEIHPYKMKQIKMFRVVEKLGQNCPDVNIYIQNERQIKYEGKNDTAVMNAKMKMAEIFDNLFHLTPELNSLRRQFILQAEHDILEVFHAKNIRATCVSNNVIEITAETEKDQQRALFFLKEELKFEPISYKDVRASSVLQDRAGNEFIRDLNADFPTALSQFNDERKCLEITGFRDGVQKHRENISAYINANAIQDQFIDLQEEKVAYLQNNFDKQRIPQSVRINWLFEPKPQIQLNGKQEDIEEAKKVLENYLQNIVEQSHTVQKIGVQALHTDQAFLIPIQRNHKCYIKIKNGGSQKRAEGLAHRPRLLKQYRLQSGETLSVYIGDLTKDNVDCIVNAANAQMNHEGGVALAIVEAGGQTIQDESYEELKKLRERGIEMNTSDSIVTGAGTLPFKKIIHVVGPRWKDGRSQEAEKLYDAVYGVLEKVNRLGLTSVALPAISSGIYGVPVEVCAKNMIRATSDFFKNNSNETCSVKSVHFTNIKSEVCQEFRNTIEDTREQGHVRNTRLELSHPRMSETIMHPSVPTMVPGRNSKTIKTPEGKYIRLERGNLAEMSVDAIVNTVGTSLDLRQGAVSRALLQKAGDSLQQECHRKVPHKNLQPWMHIETGPANLQCQVVYHISCSSYDHSNQKVNNQKFVGVLIDVFESADRSGLASIALPTIGTGGLGYPEKTIAKLMYEAAISYSKANSNGSLTEIWFVPYEKDRSVISAFEDEMKDVVKSKEASSSRSQRGSTYRNVQDTDEDTNRLRIGPVVIELKTGNIVKANTDVIVNSTDPNFDLEGPLSRAIMEAGGKHLKSECEKVGRVKILRKRVIMTSAGDIPRTKHIAHIVIDRHKDSPVNIQERIKKALQKAEKFGMTSIAIPAIGTGETNLGTPGDIAEAIFDGIGDFSLTSPRHLLHVKIVLFDTSNLAEYKEVMQLKKGKSVSSPSWWIGKRVTQTFQRVSEGLSGAWRNVANFVSLGEEVEEGLEATERRIQLEKIVFHIIAGSDQDLCGAVAEIDQFIDREFINEEIPYDENLHGELTRSKKYLIQGVANRHKTYVDFLMEPRKSKRLMIRGKKENAMQSCNDIHKVLNQIQKEEIRRKENVKLGLQIQWMYRSELDQWQPYDVETNALIETEYQAGKQYIDLDSGVRIDFIQELQISQNGRVKVYRKDKQQEEINRIPEHWEPGVNDERVELHKTTQEYCDVAQHFHETCKRSEFKIKKIERVQAVTLLKQYMAKRDEMITPEMTNSDKKVEKDLFHGTGHENVDKIIKTGFNRMLRGENGTAYGQGAYFARDAHYSTNYTKPDGTHNRCMFRVKVLVGNYDQKGNPNMKIPPEGYDSVVDTPEDPKVFVVFYDSQAYPEYLITFVKTLEV